MLQLLRVVRRPMGSVLGTGMAKSSIGYVAIIDDDWGVLVSLEVMLQVAGYRVAVYDSAGAFLSDRTATPACLIVDHNMPQMTGLELAARLRADSVHIPLLLVSGKPPADLAARAAELGVAKVLVKPLCAEDLLGFVGSVIQH